MGWDQTKRSMSMLLEVVAAIERGGDRERERKMEMLVEGEKYQGLLSGLMHPRKLDFADAFWAGPLARHLYVAP